MFGVNCEAIPRPWQVNFLTDEAGDCGKGVNAVVSCSTFSTITVWVINTPTSTQITVVDKIKTTMIHSLVWQVLTDRHTNITLSLPVGHTKFLLD